jgi:hypothetical protein
MDRGEFKELGKLLTGELEGKARPLTDEEFDQLFPDWDEVIDAIEDEMHKRKEKDKP